MRVGEISPVYHKKTSLPAKSGGNRQPHSDPLPEALAKQSVYAFAKKDRLQDGSSLNMAHYWVNLYWVNSQRLQKSRLDDLFPGWSRLG